MGEPTHIFGTMIIQLTCIGFICGFGEAATCGGYFCAASCAIRFFTGISSSFTDSSTFTAFCNQRKLFNTISLCITVFKNPVAFTELSYTIYSV
jgi:hypothetical protein